MRSIVIAAFFFASVVSASAQMAEFDANAFDPGFYSSMSENTFTVTSSDWGDGEEYVHVPFCFEEEGEEYCS